MGVKVLFRGVRGADDQLVMTSFGASWLPGSRVQQGDVLDLDPDVAARLVDMDAHSFVYAPGADVVEAAEASVEGRPWLGALDQSIASLRASLDTGGFDPHLGELLEAEMAGKSRKGAEAAIRDRLQLLADG